MATMTLTQPGIRTHRPDIRGIVSVLLARAGQFASAVNGTPGTADPVSLNSGEQTTRKMSQRKLTVGEALDRAGLPTI